MAIGAQLRVKPVAAPRHVPQLGAKQVVPADIRESGAYLTGVLDDEVAQHALLQGQA